jgi:hypothetical protein
MRLGEHLISTAGRPIAIAERESGGIRAIAFSREAASGMGRREGQPGVDFAYGMNIERIPLFAEFEEALRTWERARWPAMPDWLEDAIAWSRIDESSW